MKKSIMIISLLLAMLLIAACSSNGGQGAAYSDTNSYQSSIDNASNNYSNSTQAKTNLPIYKNGSPVSSASSLSLYDVVTFGSYPQSSFGGDSAIEWYVISKDGSRVKLMSRYALDSKQYHTSNSTVSWQGSSLYNWLNRDFKEKAFNSEEQRMIQSSITLLSRSEANSLPNEYRICTSTSYAVSCGGDQNRCIWWLSDFSGTVYFSDGTAGNCASAVMETGEIGYDGFQVNFSHKYVRPVIVVNF